MYEVLLLNLNTNSKFTKIFFDYNNFNSFVKKTRKSCKLKILSIVDNSYMYD